MGRKDVLDKVRMPVCVKALDTENAIEGYGLLLPVVGSEYGDRCINSGGRSVLFENDEKAYRLKGIDPFGEILNLVSKSKMNLIHDIVLSKLSIKYPTFQKEDDNIIVHSYGSDKPFGVLTKEQTERGEKAMNYISSAYEELGFYPPCSPEKTIRLSNIMYEGGHTYSLLFEIPDIESDLRYVELMMCLKDVFTHLPSQILKNASEDIYNFYFDLNTWNGFNSRILYENNLLPTRQSIQEQNYVLSTVKDGKMGMSRVDHTSTVQKPNIGDEKLPQIIQPYLFSNIPATLFLSTILSEKEQCPEEYHSYFDWAYKYKKPLSPQEELNDFFEKMKEHFDEGFEKNPKPIEEERLEYLLSL